MSKVFIEESTLSSIGDAIRTKGGTTALIAPLNMADAITNLPSGGGGEEIPTVFECAESRYLLAGDKLKFLLDVHPTGIIEFKGGNSTEGMVRECSGDYSRFKVYGAALVGPIGDGATITYLPDICFTTPNYSTGFQYFTNMTQLRSIRSDFFYKTDRNTGIKTTTMTNAFPSYAGMYQTFYCCYNLRTLPELPKTMTNSDGGYYQAYTDVFAYCRSLDKIEGLPVAIDYPMTDNQFYGCFGYCYRISEMTFATDNGTPYAVSWSNQTIDLTNAGYGYSASYCGEASGISTTDEVANSAQAEAIIKNPTANWWTSNANYSRYNRDSAINTINSLPNVSGGSGNTLKLKKWAGSGISTSSGTLAINNLLSSQIAVATAKGWTVSLV